MDFETENKRNVESGVSAGPEKSIGNIRYDAEVRVFQSRHGTLESVRNKLGLSRRKMCQLLLVDPSAWTRWHSPGGRIPPHVYRMLEWYLALEGKHELHPRLTDLYVRGARALTKEPRLSEAEVNELCRQVRRLKTLVWVGPVLSVATVLAWIWR